MRKKVKKLLAGLASSFMFFGSNVYAATPEGATSGGGFNFGAVIGAVLIVLVLLLGYKMDKSSEGSDKEPKPKKDKKEKFQEDEFAAPAPVEEPKENEYAPIKEDMPYEEESGERYEVEDTTVSAPIDSAPVEPVSDELPQDSFSSEPAENTLNDVYQFDTTSQVDDFSSSTAFSNEEEPLTYEQRVAKSNAALQDIDGDGMIDGFDKPVDPESLYNETMVFNGKPIEALSTSGEARTIETRPEVTEQTAAEIDELNAKREVEEIPEDFVLEPSEGEVTSFSFDTDVASFDKEDDEEVDISNVVVDDSSIVDDEEDGNNPLAIEKDEPAEEPVVASEPETSATEESNEEDDKLYDMLSTQIDSLDDLDEEAEEKVSKEVEEYKQSAVDTSNFESSEELPEFSTKEEPVEETPSFSSAEPEEETSENIEKITDEDVYTSTNSSDDEDNLDYVVPRERVVDPYEKNPETLDGYGDSNDPGFSGGLERTPVGKITDPNMSDGFEFARENEKSEKEMMSDEELVASNDLDNGFLNQMEANLKKNQEKRMNDKK